MLSEKLKTEIERDIKNNKVVVYMKGTVTAPLCGFSSRVIQILKEYGVPIKDNNVLASEELRQGIKDFKGWPTIPQVFINGEFVGGCDILTEMHESGELKKLLMS